ncbi:MAG: hypothetical protein J6D30_06015 [Clostridia bacterium]|nr:hypothetical protein [Clostridia bacterium]
MKVKEVVYLAAAELGILDEVKKFVENGTAAGKENAEKLLSSFQMVENELAVDYFPLRAEQKVETENGMITYIQLPNNVLRVLYVENESGERIHFRLFVDHLATEKGKVTVGYTYTPKDKSFNDNSDFRLQVTARLMACGIVAAYMLNAGRFEEWKIWDKKYKNAIIAAYQLPKSEYWQARRWE